MTNNIPKLEEQYIWLKDNEQITTLNQLTQLSLSSYPFTKQSQQTLGHTNIEDMRQRGNLF